MENATPLLVEPTMKFDEDYAYERQRQRKADYGVHRPQKYANHDPAPHLMFEEEKQDFYKMDKEEWMAYFLMLTVLGIALCELWG